MCNKIKLFTTFETGYFIFNFIRYTTGSTNVNFADTQDILQRKFIQFQVVIDYTDSSAVKFQTKAGTDLGCTFTVTFTILSTFP